MPTPVFAGEVTPQGKLVLHNQRGFERQKDALKGRQIEIVLRERRTQRSNRQNRWHWGVCIEMLANEFGYDRHEHEDLHYALVRLCFGTRVNPATGFEVATVRSSKLTTKQFSEFMEWAVRWAATEHGIRIPLPDDVDMSVEA